MRMNKAIYNCEDCSQNTLEKGEFYMVKRVVWHSVTKHIGKKARMLCIVCLEKRLGRELDMDDFLPVPCNLSDRHSPILMSRLRGFAEAHAGRIMDELWARMRAKGRP